MDNMIIFEKITNESGLGTLTCQVKRVSGGLMHKMFCLETTTGKFAVKLLNPEIMKRPDAFENYKIAEHFENILHKKGIPIVPALEINGKKMLCVDNQYYYIFEWVDGKTLKTNEIKKEHCELTGAILAKIHKIELSEKPSRRDDFYIEWDFYIDLSYKHCPQIADILNNNRKLLYASQDKGNLALKNVPAITAICNGDMDSKNVLWVNGKPKIIDLECLKYGNPYTELFQLALCWSGYEHCSLDYELLSALLIAYKKEYGKLEVDWEVLYNSNVGMLGWLEYNIKRSLLIECANPEEQKLGISQVKETMNQIIYYNMIKDELLKKLNSINKLN